MKKLSVTMITCIILIASCLGFAGCDSKVRGFNSIDKEIFSFSISISDLELKQESNKNYGYVVFLITVNCNDTDNIIRYFDHCYLELNIINNSNWAMIRRTENPNVSLTANGIGETSIILYGQISSPYLLPTPNSIEVEAVSSSGNVMLN